MEDDNHAQCKPADNRLCDRLPGRRPHHRPLSHKEKGQQLRRLRRCEPQPADRRADRHAARYLVRRRRHHRLGQSDMAQRSALRHSRLYRRADRHAAALLRLGARAPGDDLHDTRALRDSLRHCRARHRDRLYRARLHRHPLLAVQGRGEHDQPHDRHGA